MSGRRLERIKTAVIVLLICSLAALFLMSWSTDAASLPDGVSGFIGGVRRALGGGEAAVPVEPSRAESYGDAAQLYAIAASSGGGTRAVFSWEDGFSALAARVRPLLAECLGSAEGGSAVSRADFRAALKRGGVTLCYSSAQPLELLALSCGVEIGGAGGVWARTVLLSEEDGGAALYVGADGEYRRYSAATDGAAVRSALAEGEGGSASWSFELGFSDGAVETVYPSGDLRIPTAVASDAAAGETAVRSVLSAFSMNPATNYRYTSADGTQYAVEGGRVLALSADGLVSYADQSGEGDALRASASDCAVIEHCRALAEEVRSVAGGDAELILKRFERDGEGEITVAFGCALGGIPVYTDGAGECAVFTLKEGRITAASVSLRVCRFDGGSALMMPPESAAAVGAKELAYYDERGGGCAPEWSR